MNYANLIFAVETQYFASPRAKVETQYFASCTNSQRRKILRLYGAQCYEIRFQFPTLGDKIGCINLLHYNILNSNYKINLIHSNVMYLLKSKGRQSLFPSFDNFQKVVKAQNNVVLKWEAGEQWPQL